MYKIPSLPFACSIAGGEQHAGVKPVNEAVFNLKYFAKLYKIHQDDIPQMLSEKLAEELSYYASGAHKDLALVMFERLITLESKGIVCIPVPEHQKKGLAYATIAYHFSQSDETLTAVFSLMSSSGKEHTDCPFLSFTAERTPDTVELSIAIATEIEVPIMLKHGKSLVQLHDLALYWTKFICAFEAMLTYQCIMYKSFLYDAMLEKNGVRLNPNYVQVSLLTLENEEKNTI